MKRLGVIFSAIGLAVVIALILGVRWFGPHDLYEKDQPKTMAYTADMLVNGRWSLPRDVIYQPATKPPLYNWIDVVVVKITGSWNEWTLKLPSILGSLATGAIVFAMTRRMFTHADPCGVGSDSTGVGVNGSTTIALLATAIWFTFGSDVRHGSVLRMGYLARPDMLQCAFLSGAWACATIAIQRDSARKSRNPAIGFWLCVTAAALTKGPAAVMPIVFACAFAVWSTSSAQPIRQQIKKLHTLIGLPILILGVGSWLACAYAQDPQHVKSVIFGAEIAGRIIDKSPEGIAKPFYYSAMWFVTKALPWGGIALIAVVVWASVRELRTRWAFAAIYLIVVLACLSLPAGKRMDYLLPAYAPGAVLVSALLAEIALRLRVPQAVLMLLPVYLAVSISHRYLKQFHESIEHWSDRTVAFVNEVRHDVDLKHNRVLVLVRGKHPITTLLGENPGSYLTRADLAAAEYVIAPVQPDWHAVVISEPVPIGFETLETRKLAKLGLYHFAPGQAPVDRLVELQKQVGQWTPDENPYHEAGTVYRDE